MKNSGILIQKLLAISHNRSLLNYEKSSSGFKTDLSTVWSAYPVRLWEPGKEDKESAWKATKTSLPLSSSDVDIGVTVMSGGKFSVTEKVDLALALEDLFGCKRVDLVSLSDTDPFLAAEVIRGERLFGHNEHEADEYELYVLRRAGDLAPLERERMALVLGEST